MASKNQEKEEETIDVRATKVGFYNNQRYYPADHDHRRAGEVFTLHPVRTKDPKTGKPVVIPASRQFSKFWMEKVGKEEARRDANLREGIAPKRHIITKVAAHRSPSGVI